MKCPLCQSLNNNFLFNSYNIHGHHYYGNQKFKLYECQQCKCIFPKINVDNNYFKKYYPHKYNKKSPLLEKAWSNFNNYLKKKFLPKQGTLLDVGCGEGQFLRSLPPTIHATGIDLNISPDSRLSFIKNDFIKYKFSQKYDVITFWHSLEHFPDPQKTINKAVKMLNNNGQIIISIPNTNSLAFKLGKENWYHLDSPRHLFLPNNINIKNIFPKKFKIKISYNPVEFPLDLFWSTKNIPLLWPIYPLLKLFDKETMFIIASKKISNKH